MTDFPVEAERVSQAAQFPAMSASYGEYRGGAGLDRLMEESFGVRDGKDHADGIATKGRVGGFCGFYTGFLCPGRVWDFGLFLGVYAVRRGGTATDPEFGSAYGEPEDGCAIGGFDPVGFDCIKGGHIEPESGGPIGDG